MLFRALTLLFMLLLALPATGDRRALAQASTPEDECTTNPVHFAELAWHEAESYLLAPDAPEDINAGITATLDQYAGALNRADVLGALEVLTPELAGYFGWACDPRITEATPEATPEPREYAIEQVRLVDDEIATAFLSLPDAVHGPKPDDVSDRVFFVVLERVKTEWKIALIGDTVVFRDVVIGVSGQPMMYPAIDLRDSGMPKMPPDATPVASRES